MTPPRMETVTRMILEDVEESTLHPYCPGSIETYQVLLDGHWYYVTLTDDPKEWDRQFQVSESV